MSTIVTFYSYKGGVGRSMAMANIAVLIAQRGLKVLAVDWDLEAPGLERYFSYFEQATSSGGLLPFLSQVLECMKKGESLPSYRDHLWTINIGGGNSFSLFPSGRDTHTHYATMLGQFDWHEFFSIGGGDVIERLREEWLSQFDVVLIDSRTGMSDTGGICTIQIPDVLVAMFTANDQSMLGVLDIIHAAQRGRQQLAYDRMTLTILPLVSRFSTLSEVQKSSTWLDRFAENFSGICDEWLLPWIPMRSVFERLKIPQVDWFSFGERLAVVEQGTSDPSSIGFAFDRITDLLASDFKNLDGALGSIAAKPLDWKSRELKQAISNQRPNDDYKYDLYVSYHHGGVLNEWVRTFVDSLVDWLSLELPHQPVVFIDTKPLNVGESWDLQLQKAITESRLMLAILTPAYFASEFCKREWAIFEERERLSSSQVPLIVPVVLRGGLYMPQRVRLRQLIDASDIPLVSSEGKMGSKEEYRLLQRSVGVIAKTLPEVGPYDPDVKIVVTDEILKDLSPPSEQPVPSTRDSVDLEHHKKKEAPAPEGALTDPDYRLLRLKTKIELELDAVEESIREIVSKTHLK